MSIEDLETVVSPPVHPREMGTHDSFKEVEKELGLRLPKDFLEYSMRYGSGVFNDPGRLCIFVRNAFAPEFVETLRVDCAYTMETPYAVYPDNPGLIPWASDDNGIVIYWLTEGEPNSWPIVFYNEIDFLRCDLTMTTFLAQAFKRTLSPTPWPEPVFFSGPRPVKFASTRDEIEYQ